MTLRELRKARNLTAGQLAQRLGVTEMTIYRWERGEMWPRKTQVENLARELGVSESIVAAALAN